ncbi:phosphohydrolase [Pseudomonas putida]|uniref:HD domain-containing protein n=1 Tax=Pseudomonas sp. A2 TaxID=107445 RepID=UPI001FFF3998|nr:HD domain-containing protein [Pseudomonas sp. A2]UPK86399.1 metal-dependent phosphohydrolase [Pseudomonas sp. A2]GLO31263.1 phosphohydrolase [Pseudomonas putida]
MDSSADSQSTLKLLRMAMEGCASIKLSDGETVLNHALWCAHQAMNAHCDSQIVVAALFHDLGHYLCAGDPELADYHRDREHATLGARWLARWFPLAVCAPVDLHVDAKRYLVTVDADYRQRLGAGSLQSLNNQGGVMTSEEVSEFRRAEHFESALLVRQFDDVPFNGETLSPYLWYEPIVVSVMR